MSEPLKTVLAALWDARDEHRRNGDYHAMIFCIRVIERVLMYYCRANAASARKPRKPKNEEQEQNPVDNAPG